MDHRGNTIYEQHECGVAGQRRCDTESSEDKLSHHDLDMYMLRDVHLSSILSVLYHNCSDMDLMTTAASDIGHSTAASEIDHSTRDDQPYTSEQAPIVEVDIGRLEINTLCRP